MDMTFRRAKSAETAAAQQVYRTIIDHLAQTVDFPHWHTENHPTPAEVAQWVGAGELYLATVSPGSAPDAPEGIAGVVVLNHDAPDAYLQAAWTVPAAGQEVLVVHALGVVPDYLGRGVARRIVDKVIETARARGCRAVRLDTYVENIPARELYRRYGFTDLGAHTLRYEGTDLDCFHLFEYVV
ncbi:GNAT family N-acetyltransferase [Ruania zhangjianzhongii]|uniref:GNAT family N-acetyltransferase n=1 Tax=Ruania zhangjianzhongii TaxID=2603206 RepID=UPI0011C72063|nr:GNAT family N-acetyltransferase [Ruania zhangjianzhongii]